MNYRRLKSSGKAVVFILCLIAFTTSCTRQPEFENFDSARWKTDKMGCNKQRLEMLESLYEISDQLRGLKHNQIIDLLGRPDATELYKRGQRFYRYYVSPAAKCEVQSDNSVDSLEIRFNALGFVSEVNITIAVRPDS